MPLFRRLAKRGFSSGDTAEQKWIAIVNVGALSKLAGVVPCNRSAQRHLTDEQLVGYLLHHNFSFQSLRSKLIADRKCSFACSLHQLPIIQWHCGRGCFHGACQHARFSPGGIDFRYAHDTRTHGQNLCGTIRS